jgi:hypothetical protein
VLGCDSRARSTVTGVHGLDLAAPPIAARAVPPTANPSVSETAGLDLSIRVLLLVVFIGMPVIDPRP